MKSAESRGTAPPLGSCENPVLAAGVLLWRSGPEGPEFLLLKNAKHGTWGFPKGHAEIGEEIRTCALRETEEETGVALKPEHLDPDFADTVIYRPPGKPRPWQRKLGLETGFWKRVVYFLAEIPDAGSGFRRSKEHQSHQWCSEAQALEVLEHEDSRRTLIRAAWRIHRHYNAAP